MNDSSPIDLRSDTVTRPTPAMREAMASAAVGDDQYGEDPTTNQLQERMAALLGKEAALWMPSGTMANQVALFVLARPGDEVITSRESHAGWHEAGGAAANAGVQIVEVGDKGRFTREQGWPLYLGTLSAGGMTVRPDRAHRRDIAAIGCAEQVAAAPVGCQIGHAVGKRRGGHAGERTGAAIDRESDDTKWLGPHSCIQKAPVRTNRHRHDEVAGLGRAD